MGLAASVESVMRSPPVTALFSDSVLAVANKMFSQNIGAVIIMSGGNPVGIITERDIVGKVIRERGDVSKIRAQEIMSSPLVTVDADKSVAEALELMRDKKQEIRRLAVTRQARLVGIVTERRLLDTLI